MYIEGKEKSLPYGMTQSRKTKGCALWYDSVRREVLDMDEEKNAYDIFHYKNRPVSQFCDDADFFF